MKKLLILLVFLPFFTSAQYEVNLNLPQSKEFMNNYKWVGYSLLAVSSFTDGVVEGYEFDGRKSFERKFNSNPNGFFGSQSWRKDHTLYAQLLGVPDFYHIADDFRTYGRMGGASLITIGGFKNKNTRGQWIADIALSFMVSAAFKRAGMDWIRN